MQAQCIRIDVVEGAPSPALSNSLVRLTLHATIDGQPTTVDLDKQLRPLIGPLRANRRQAVLATMPPMITLNAQKKWRLEYHVVADHDLRFWAEQIKLQLSAKDPFHYHTVPCS